MRPGMPWRRQPQSGCQDQGQRSRSSETNPRSKMTGGLSGKRVRSRRLTGSPPSNPRPPRSSTARRFLVFRKPLSARRCSPGSLWRRWARSMQRNALPVNTTTEAAALVPGAMMTMGTRMRGPGWPLRTWCWMGSARLPPIWRAKRGAGGLPVRNRRDTPVITITCAGHDGGPGPHR